ncbi:hypothetical protein [Sulfuriroseicoccus oceanibius]|uniref:Lipoprotein n=1 Tax=Sulfuriroseicoccus oceanibius TaxID=2707525 RepID=A0A6B3L094_9BACT|nr:hypothetical protein [Sulfuriroseicoccus oceanibius]QQL43784.1 hypothetical protein G3M56_007685 [Sulfuriroseicoccus oceanibius]
MKSLLTSSLAIALAAGLASCGKQPAPTSESALPDALPTETELTTKPATEQPVEAAPTPAPPEPAPAFSMTRDALAALIKNSHRQTVFEQLGEPFEKDENINKYRHNIWRYRGEITNAPSISTLELVVGSGKSPKILSFGYPETYEASRQDTMMDEDAFRAAVADKTESEIISALGAPTFYSTTTDLFGEPYYGIIYRMWIRRDNNAYPGATINFKNGKYTGYSFHMDEVKELGE